MKALVKAYDKPGLWLQQVDRPEPGPEDVLIRVHEVAICGTDLHIYNWDQWAQEHVPVPMTIGHEYIGVIEEIGELVHSVEVGDAATCAAIRAASVSTGPARSPSTSASRRTTPTRSRPRSATILPPFSIRSVTRCTPRCPSTWSARTC